MDRDDRNGSTLSHSPLPEQLSAETSESNLPFDPNVVGIVMITLCLTITYLGLAARLFTKLKIMHEFKLEDCELPAIFIRHQGALVLMANLRWRCRCVGILSLIEIVSRRVKLL